MKYRYLLIAVIAFTQLTSVSFARQWVNQKRQVISANLIKVKGNVATLQEEGGTRTLKVPLEELSEEDKLYVADWLLRQHISQTSGGGASSAPQTTANRPALRPPARAGNDSSAVIQQLQGNLIKKQGSVFQPYSIPPGKRYLVLYYSAHWCGPCRKFTPQLADFYRSTNFSGNSPYELVFVSSDNSQREMAEYMKWGKMEFPAVIFSNKSAIPVVSSNQGRGIPHLVVLDANTGAVLASSYVRGKYVGPHAPLEELKRLIQ